MLNVPGLCLWHCERFRFRIHHHHSTISGVPMPITLSEDEAGTIGFMCSCYLDDTKREIKKSERKGIDMTYAKKLWVERFKLVYQKVIPGSWCGSPESLEAVTFDSKEG